MNKATKLQKRREELIQRTCEIFNINPEQAESLFIQPKTSVVITNELAKEFVQNNIANGNLRNVPFLENAYIIEKNKNLFTQSDEFKNGYIYIQNISSLLPSLALEPNPKEMILDMCAAPGGKTIQIAKKADGEAEIFVNDENPTRVAAMKKLFETYKVKINSYYSQPAQYLSKHLPPEYFDKILLDAPCSGEGLIDLTKPATLSFWSTKKIKRLSKLQKSMIAEAYKLLKKDGVLVYSTCTLAPEENEEVINWALTNFKDLHVESVQIKDMIENATDGLINWKGKTLNLQCKNCVRIKPNQFMEAFFVCKLKKI